MKTNRLIAIVFAAALMAGCGTENPFDRGPDSSSGIEEVPTGTVSFATHVTSALSACVACHAAGAGGWSYTGGADAHASALQEVNLGDPASSALLVKGSGGDGHGGGTIFTVGSTDYQTILLWIEQGGANN